VAEKNNVALKSLKKGAKVKAVAVQSVTFVEQVSFKRGVTV